MDKQRRTLEDGVYTIRRGDTLSSIAKEFGISIKELVDKNNIDNTNLIYTGHKLKVNDSKPKIKSVPLESTQNYITRPTEEKPNYKVYFDVKKSNFTPKQTQKKIIRNGVKQEAKTLTNAWTTNTSIGDPTDNYTFSTTHNQVYPEDKKGQPTLLDKIKDNEHVKDLIGIYNSGNPVERVYNGIARKFDIGSNDVEVSGMDTIPIIAPDTIPARRDDVLDEEALNRVLQGNRISKAKFRGLKFGSGNVYMNSAGFNPMNYKYNIRNANDTTGVEVDDVGAIPMYKDWKQADANFNPSQHVKADDGTPKEFFVVDKDGNLKHGNSSLITPGSYYTPAYYSYFEKFDRDDKGNLVLKKAAKDSGRKSPRFSGYNGKGEPVSSQELFLMTNRGGTRTNGFGDAEGGAYILNIDNDYYVTRGSIDQVVQQIEEFQKNHKGKKVKLIQPDNGSYSSGLNSSTNWLNNEDLKSYYSQNAVGGALLIPRVKRSMALGGAIDY